MKAHPKLPAPRLTTSKRRARMKWTDSVGAVGCYWNASRVTWQALQKFTIGTYILIRNGEIIYTFPDSGYSLTCNRREVGKYRSLKQAQNAAERVARDAFISPGANSCRQNRSN